MKDLMKARLVNDALDIFIELNKGIFNKARAHIIFYHFIIVMDKSGSMNSKDDGKKTRWHHLLE